VSARCDAAMLMKDAQQREYLGSTCWRGGLSSTSTATSATAAWLACATAAVQHRRLRVVERVGQSLLLLLQALLSLHTTTYPLLAVRWPRSTMVDKHRCPASAH
jgi:hypothetical protein